MSQKVSNLWIIGYHKNDPQKWRLFSKIKNRIEACVFPTDFTAQCGIRTKRPTVCVDPSEDGRDCNSERKLTSQFNFIIFSYPSEPYDKRTEPRIYAKEIVLQSFTDVFSLFHLREEELRVLFEWPCSHTFGGTIARLDVLCFEQFEFSVHSFQIPEIFESHNFRKHQ